MGPLRPNSIEIVSANLIQAAFKAKKGIQSVRGIQKNSVNT